MLLGWSGRAVAQCHLDSCQPYTGPKQDCQKSLHRQAAKGTVARSSDRSVEGVWLLFHYNASWQ